jgi:hypothetical protein
MPVVLFAEADLLPSVLAGSRRAGREPTTLELPTVDARTLAAAAAQGVEVAVGVVPVEKLIAALNLVRARGGRGVPVLGFLPGTDAPRIAEMSLSFLAAPALLDLNVPIPAIEDDARRLAVWDQLRAASLEVHHHLVEVDGTPALEELAGRGNPAPKDPWRALAAGAAGVLAGRLAAANRRWRDPLER